MDVKESELLLRIAAQGARGIEITPERWDGGWEAVAWVARRGERVELTVDVVAPDGETPDLATTPALGSVEEVAHAVESLLPRVAWKSPPRGFLLSPEAEARLALVLWACRPECVRHASNVVLAAQEGAEPCVLPPVTPCPVAWPPKPADDLNQAEWGPGIKGYPC